MKAINKITSDAKLKELSRDFFKKALEKRLSMENIETEENTYEWPYISMELHMLMIFHYGYLFTI